MPKAKFAEVEPKKMGRPTNFTEYLEDVIVDLVASGLSQAKVAKAIKVHKSQISRWAAMFPDFRQRLLKARDYVSLGKVEKSQLRTATGYKYDEVTKELTGATDADGEPVMVVTKRVTKHVKPSTSAQQHILQNLNPTRWKQIKHNLHSGRIELVDPKKAMAARQEEFVDAEFEEVKQIEEGKDDD